MGSFYNKEPKFHLFPLFQNVRDFDVAKEHCGILTQDNQIINYDYNLMKEVELSNNEREQVMQRRTSSFEIGNIKAISSGNGFNLLVTENDEVYAQSINGKFTSFYSIAQPFEYDKTQSIFKIEMISDYNTIHKTKVTHVF